MAQRGGVVESIRFSWATARVTASPTEKLTFFWGSNRSKRSSPAAKKCSSNTLVITNTAPVFPFTVALGHAVYPDIPPSLAVSGLPGGRPGADLDATTLARLAGSVQSLNVVMLGALASSGVLSDIGTGAFQKAIQGKMKAPLALQNLRAFQSGYEACQNEVRGNSACAVE